MAIESAHLEKWRFMIGKSAEQVDGLETVCTVRSVGDGFHSVIMS
jgi:hypothetical protein